MRDVSDAGTSKLTRGMSEHGREVFISAIGQVWRAQRTHLPQKVVAQPSDVAGADEYVQWGTAPERGHELRVDVTFCYWPMQCRVRVVPGMRKTYSYSAVRPDSIDCLMVDWTAEVMSSRAEYGMQMLRIALGHAQHGSTTVRG